MSDTKTWLYMVDWLQGHWRVQEDVDLLAMIYAKAEGSVHPGVVHKKLTK